jgi:hypothetical protein
VLPGPVTTDCTRQQLRLALALVLLCSLGLLGTLALAVSTTETGNGASKKSNCTAKVQLIHTSAWLTNLSEVLPTHHCQGMVSCWEN